MTYKVVLTYTGEGYSVGCPELPGCSSQGQTEEEAISNIREAIREAIQERLAGRPKAEPASKVRFVEVPEIAEAEDGWNGEAKPAKFVVTPIMRSEFPAEWTSHKVEDLLRILAEKPKH